MYPGNPRKLLKEQTLALSFLQRLGTFLSHHTLLFFPNTCCIPAAREMNPSHGQWKCELIEPHWRAAWWYLLNCNHTHSMAQRVYLHTTQHLPTGTLIHAHEESCPREANTASLITADNCKRTLCLPIVRVCLGYQILCHTLYTMDLYLCHWQTSKIQCLVEQKQVTEQNIDTIWEHFKIKYLYTYTKQCYTFTSIIVWN